ncbi:hypothetical protein MKW94_005836 [Papaver nudicaule]|uniref:Uncharacterized protein n=1 Tax=Papaver nudicaule TaxID=74823 RepID=A0AA41VQW2_PAPNU|nr:hypothetical protein [Papaver nudicaule]
MKTISGAVVSSKPVSLSTAASHMKGFLAADMGVPPALSAYVQRTTSAFNELVRLHKDAKAGKSDRKHKKDHTKNQAVEGDGNLESEIGEKKTETKKRSDVNGNEIDLAEDVERRSTGDQVESEIGEKKKRKKKNVDAIEKESVEVVEKENDVNETVGVVEGGNVGDQVGEKRKEKKKRKKEEVEDEKLQTSEEKQTMKKKKKRKLEV